MTVICNTHVHHTNHVEILVTKTNDPSYLERVLVDPEDLAKVGKVRVDNKGYVYSKTLNIAHIVMGHNTNMETVIDHINGNRKDTRKINLRVLKQCDNANNRNNSKNNTGVVGIALRTNGNYHYYRATVFDRRKPVFSGKTQAATKRFCKQFNINKLGKAKAMAEAKLWLYAKRKEFGYVNY